MQETKNREYNKINNIAITARGEGHYLYMSVNHFKDGD